MRPMRASRRTSALFSFESLSRGRSPPLTVHAAGLSTPSISSRMTGFTATPDTQTADFSTTVAMRTSPKSPRLG